MLVFFALTNSYEFYEIMKSINIRLNLIECIKDDHAIRTKVEIDDEAAVCERARECWRVGFAGDVGGEVGIIAVRFDRR